MKDVHLTSYTEDNTPYVISDNINKDFFELERTIETLFKLSADNEIKANNGKCNRKKLKIQSISNRPFSR